MRKPSLFFGLLFFLAIPVQAEIVNCNGVWTTGTCDEKPLAKMQETEGTGGEKNPELSEKKTLLHDLNSLRYDIKNKYGTNIPVNTAERICSDPESSVEACQKAVSTAEDRLLKRQLALAELERKEEHQEQVKEKLSEVVVIQQNQDDHLFDRHSGPTIIDGERIRAGRTRLVENNKKPVPENTLIDQQKGDSADRDHIRDRVKEGYSKRGNRGKFRR